LALYPDKVANSHVHLKATEIYVVMKGRTRLYAWLGRKWFTIEAGVGDILRLPPIVPYKVEIDPDDRSMLLYAVRTLAAHTDYKQPWPAKTRF